MLSSKSLFNGLGQMLRIRMVEEAIAKRYPEQEMRCAIHLSVGQEAAPVSISSCLRQDDQVFSGHRCHAHYLAKGGSLTGMIAELYGRVDGCARGRGGSMHLVDYSVGMMGSSALVGGTIPIAVGAGFAFQSKGEDRVAVSYFGDGATEEGIFYESLNIAMLKKLPVIFACENNLYATYSHQTKRQAACEIYKRGESFGLEGVRVDGNDYEACFDVSVRAIEKARKGGGPTLIEFQTYRFLDHVGPNDDSHIGYRTKEEIEGWKSKCPIQKLTNKLLGSKMITEEELSGMKTEIAAEIESAFVFAKKSPYPEISEIFADVY
jgi:pyruvate dehydrogenase E1 component alpha subunit